MMKGNRKEAKKEEKRRSFWGKLYTLGMVLCAIIHFQIK